MKNCMQWNLEGVQVSGTYLDDFPVIGLVVLSRVMYGGDVCHTIQLTNPITVFGAVRDRVILKHNLVTCVCDAVAAQVA